ncbi:MAG: hypothetical protein IPO31_00250 [Candidatus Obscuribacter sp.]|nr:hypothetical protein [Candidatus Obscuribacter sp.]
MSKADQNFDSVWQVKAMARTWKAIRDGLKKADARDCLDYLEFDLLAEQRIRELRLRIINGTYIPKEPGKFELAKSRGAYRVMSVLTAEDALVFRHLVDHIYRLAQRNEPVGVFFAQGQPTLPKGPNLKSLDGIELGDYDSGWALWLRYQQYRTRTMLTQIRPVLVVTDITNFLSLFHMQSYWNTYRISLYPRSRLGSWLGY